MDVLIKKRDWLFPVALILFLLAIILFPFAMELTYAGRSESPSHILTYTTGALTWDSDTDIDENGAAKLHLFDTDYQNVQSDNGDNVVAPGTEKLNIVRLKNGEEYSVEYVAVMYRIQEEGLLPVTPVFTGEGYSDASQYPLPEGIKEEQVVGAVTGTLESNQVQDFDISWQWEYEVSEEQDQIDTWLGNEAAFAEAEEVTAGIYIMVMEDSSSGQSYLYPQLPKTGDNHAVWLYLVLMTVSVLILVILILEQRRSRR